MNKEELIQAAERLILHGETLGGCGNPYYNSEYESQFDEIAVGEAFLEQCKRIEELEKEIKQLQYEIYDLKIELSSLRLEYYENRNLAENINS